MRPIVKLLGYAGLLPFIGLAITSLIFAQNSLSVEALSLYSFGIFAFLCGAWWPAQDMQQANFWRIVLSNVFFLMAFFSYIFLSELWLLIGAGLFIMLWGIESFSLLLPKSSKEYFSMRANLTTIASLSMFITYTWGVA
jgi:hypothetical protein